MKKILTLIALTMVLITSCKKDVNSPDNNGVGNSTITPGDYTITKFTDASSGGDKASIFSGYTFIFNDDGTVIAEKNGVAQTGTYN